MCSRKSFSKEILKNYCISLSVRDTIIFVGHVVSHTEEYPSPAEGSGLENRQGVNAPRGFESLLLRHIFKTRPTL